MDKEMLAAVVSRSVGDKLQIRWSQDDHVRVTTMKVLELAPDSKVENGSLAGAVLEKGKDWITIKLADGSKEKLIIQRIIGAKDEPDKDMLKAIAATSIGQQVQAKWFRDGERRVYSLAPATASRPAGGRPTASRPAADASGGAPSPQS